METPTLTTQLPLDLADTLDAVCKRLGLWKSLVVEDALWKKIADLLDTEDLREAMTEATRFHAWKEVKAEART